MFTHSLKAKSFYHRLLVVSHSLLPSPLRVVCLERLVWCFPFEKLIDSFADGGDEWMSWAHLSSAWCDCVCISVLLHCVCMYECVLEWTALYSLLLSRAPYAGPCRPSACLWPLPPLLFLPCPCRLHWLHKLAQWARRAPQLASTPHLTWDWPLQCVPLRPSGPSLAACHSDSPAWLCQPRGRSWGWGTDCQDCVRKWG